MPMDRSVTVNARFGFTLVELLIVIAIIGILAGIATPFYLSYVTKAKVSEALSVASEAKAGMADYIITYKAFPPGPTQAGIVLITTNYLQSMTVNNSGLISLKINQANLGIDLTLNLQAAIASGAVTWTCTASGADTDYAPSTCR
jgi:type IV pilus assembly protein PilA